MTKEEIVEVLQIIIEMYLPIIAEHMIWLDEIINQIEDVNNHYSLEHISYELDKRWNEKWDEEGEE